MNIPTKYEDVVAKLDAALGRESALREELDRTKKSYEAYGIDFDRLEEKAELLQQRLTVAEQRLGDAYEWGYGDGQNAPNGYSDKEDRDKCVAELLKPAAEQEKSCPNCKVCMGSPDFPENCLINGVKP